VAESAEYALSLKCWLLIDKNFLEHSIFLWFMEKNEVLYYPDGTKCIADTAGW